MKKEKILPSSFTDDLVLGLKYPWNHAKRQWNILWILLPIFGWFALIGYGKKIVLELVSDKRQGLPAFGNFWNNFKEGAMIFILMLPTFLAIGFLNVIPVAGRLLATLIQLFLLPWLTINFFVKGKFDALWELENAYDAVFSNVKEYIVFLLQSIIFGTVYWFASFILIGIPGMAFGHMYFFTKFYQKHQLKLKK